MKVIGGSVGSCAFCAPISAGLSNSMMLAASALGFGRRHLRELFSKPWLRRLFANQVKGLAVFGRRTPQPAYAPAIVVYDITNECNLSCAYCHRDAGRALPDELTKREKLSLVDQLAEAGSVALMIAGGEPLLCPDLPDVIAHARKREMFTVVITNGVLLTESVARKLREAGLNYIKVSLDSADPAVHDSLRGEGSWKAAIRGIESGIKAGLPTGIALTLTRANAGELPKVVSLAKRLGVCRIILFNFVPSGRGAMTCHLDLAGEERESVLKWALDRTYERLACMGGLEISTTAPQGPRIAIERVLSRIPRESMLCAASRLTDYGQIQALAGLFGQGCTAGINVVSISPNGDVRPCCMTSIIVDNVRNRPFAEIWLKNPILNRLRDRRDIKGWCASCRFLLECGGCRSRAHAYFGDLFASDPSCAYGRQVD